MLVSKFAEPLTVRGGIWQNNRNPKLVVHKLLKELACQSTAKIEKLFREISLGENETLGADTSANRVGDITERSDRDA